jgi:hypothetical protein
MPRAVPAVSLAACPVALPAGLTVTRFGRPAEAIETVKRIARAGSIDVGGGHLVSKADGRIYYYDVNSTSNFVANAEAVIGFDRPGTLRGLHRASSAPGDPARRSPSRRGSRLGPRPGALGSGRRTSSHGRPPERDARCESPTRSFTTGRWRDPATRLGERRLRVRGGVLRRAATAASRVRRRVGARSGPARLRGAPWIERLASRAQPDSGPEADRPASRRAPSRRGGAPHLPGNGRDRPGPGLLFRVVSRPLDRIEGHLLSKRKPNIDIVGDPDSVFVSFRRFGIEPRFRVEQEPLKPKIRGRRRRREVHPPGEHPGDRRLLL